MQSGPETEVWRALDTALDRPVAVRLAGPAVTPDVLDAARRASVVDDPRLLRVLDVGTVPGGPGGPLGYVVSELADGETLAARLQHHGPLPASVVRRVVGEAAQAVERAREAGLHHGRLTPSALVLTPDDDVKIAGMGVDAALESGDAEDGDAAARADAVGLVALLYAGLTGRWPLRTSPGLDPAPRVGEQPVPPADLVPGVPNDLDTLCAVTFGPHGDGPRTPGELAEQLAPWGRPDAEAPDERDRMRPPGRFPVRLAGTAGAVGAAAAAAATAAGIREERRDAGFGGRTVFPPHGEADLRPQDGPPDDHPLPEELPPAADPPAEDAVAGAPPAAPGGRHAGVVLGIVAALVVLGLAFAVDSLTALNDELPEAAPAPPAAPATTAPATTPPSPAPTTPPTATPTTTPPRIQGVRTLDPQGDDGTENDEAAPLAIDGDPGTEWTSSTYTTAGFGNLKDGLGMVVDLGRPSTLTGVRLLADGTGGQVEIRTSDSPDLDGSQVLSTAAIDGDPVDVALPEPVEVRYVVLWFTRLPDAGDGYRVELAEVEVR